MKRYTSEGVTEHYDIATLGNKIPHQILATVESGNWVFQVFEASHDNVSTFMAYISCKTHGGIQIQRRF
ncbi:MAG: hypothetical protein HKUEN01_21150 [Candidatus Kuenenia stuttgartiensis]|nr:MAG: hypothetical protein HKUEN01_21150 [Candidatus Kuenenia stuttgartiensis]